MDAPLRSLLLASMLAACPSSKTPPEEIVPVPAPAPTLSIEERRAASTAAYRAQDWAGFLEHQRALVDLQPDSLLDRYNLACGLALSGRNAEAIAELQHLLDHGADFGAGQDPDFASLRGDPAFDALVEKFDALFPPVHHSERAFYVTEQLDLAPEGIAYDPATGRFFVGSMRTGDIWAIDKEGAATKFATLAVGETPVGAIGLAVDAARNRLWAIGTALDLHQAWQESMAGTTALLGLDLATGALEETHARPTGPTDFGFNDLALGPDGTIYLSGTDLYVLRPGEEVPSVLGVQPPITNSNGITLGGEPGVLYIAADVQSIARVDLAARTRQWLTVPEGVNLRAFDGLYYTDGALVGVQYGLGRWRVVRLDLDRSGAAVTGVEVLEQRNAEIAGVTTGVVLGGELYYVGRDIPPEGMAGAWAGRAAVWKTPVRPAR